MVEQIILDLITANEENFLIENRNEYCIGYSDGYNDALIDLLNYLGIKHIKKLEIINFIEE